ncbi:uncharacterized protein LOC143287853 [Babylonia areolata]|uniref:uncharacterized protein LOC143287853 n=1 Tax=Babylonia areolata TaxID=304850 RepID=UPI003FD688E5
MPTYRQWILRPPRQKRTWHCVVCAIANYSTIAFDLHGSKQASKQDKHSRPLRFLNVNCYSIVGKVAEFSNLVQATRPDIIVGTESWLTQSHKNAEIFPRGFAIYRRDRPPGEWDKESGGGVFILVSEDLTSHEMPELSAGCENLWRLIPIYTEECKEPLKEAVQEMNDHVMSTFDEKSSVEEVWTEMRTGLSQELSDHVPHKQTRSKPSLLWVDCETKKLIRSQDRVHRRMKKNGDEALKQEFKALKRLIQKRLRRAYWRQVEGLISDEGENQTASKKKFWSFVKARRTEGVGVSPLKEAGKLISDPKELLKTVAEEITPAFTLLYCISYSSGTLPQDWKQANITPIFKKGEKYKAANYRPISLTCIACKLMEHIITSHIMSHFENNEILWYVDEATREIEKGNQEDTIVLDFSKAFDKVSHTLLVHKLRRYGIRGRTNAWIKNFLKDRQQAVVVEGTRSDLLPVESGVPQGSVLGPSLFLLYINDLPDGIKSKIRLFADDTMCSKTIMKKKDEQVLQEDLHSLTTWEEKWSMEFHPQKCSTLRVSRKRDKTAPAYELHGQKIENVSTTKYLGVNIQDNMQWESHIDSITMKASKTLGFVRRNLKIGNKKTKETAYKALVRPFLEYAATVWDPYTANKVEAPEKIQRRAARWVSNRHRQTSCVDSILDSLNWPSLQQRRKKARLEMFYKFHHGLISIDSKYLPKPSKSRTNNRLSYDIPSCKTLQTKARKVSRRPWYVQPHQDGRCNSNDGFGVRKIDVDVRYRRGFPDNKNNCGEHNIHTHICCDGTLTSRNGNDRCCGSRAYNSDTQLCCQFGSTTTLSSRTGGHDACCGSKTYSTARQVCCQSPTSYSLSTRHNPHEACCGMTRYNKQQKICCTNKSGSSTSLSTIRGGQTACCGTRTYDPRNKLCCQSHDGKSTSIMTRFSNDACCGMTPYNSREKICCTSSDGSRTVLSSRRGQVACCGTVVYNSRTHICCGDSRVVTRNGRPDNSC